jgi:hypothetical protein
MIPNPSIRRLLFLAALAATLGACAATVPRHDAPSISPNRPGLAEGTGTVGAGVLQVESGYSYARTDAERRHSIGEAVVRYGIGARTEVRLGLNSYTLQRTDHAWAGGVEDAAVDVVLHLAEGNRHPLLPDAAVILGSTLPTGGTAWGSTHAGPSGLLALEWPLAGGIGLASNAGYSYDPLARRWTPGALHSVALKRAVRAQLRGFADYTLLTSLSGDESRTHHFTLGLGYEIGSDLLLDLWSGAAFRDGEREALVGLGLSRRW